VQGIVNYLLQYAPGVSPHHLEHARRPGIPLTDRFDTWLRAMPASLGDATLETEPLWYPKAATVAGWRRDGKTLVLVLERPTRSGAAVLLWCVSDGELATLTEAARTRADRVAAADFDQHFDRQITYMAKGGGGSVLYPRILVDDLAAIPERAEKLLAGKLQDLDGEIRCVAAEVVLALGGGLPAVLPLLDDPEVLARWCVIGMLSHYGDESAVDPLIAKLRSDPDAGVRGQAAYALGHLGSPAAIPHLLHALDHDQEYDEQGHSPSSTSATALDKILGMNETRIQHDGGLCSLAPWKPDYDALRSRAWELYRRWKGDRDVP
jgi:hypothetical protein